MDDKKQESAGIIMSGLFWVACARVAQTLMQFLVIVLLARLISPADFGIVGAAMIVIGFSEIITELGLGAAIVQREELSEHHLSTGFSVSIVFALFSGTIVFLLAPYLAAFFGSPQIEPVLKVLALLFPLRGIGTIGEALAQRESRFRWLAIRDVFSFGAGYFVFGVVPALLGYGVWALVAANLATAALKTLLLLVSYPPKSLLFSRKAFRELLSFGGGHTLARFANFSARQGDNFIVGRFLGMTALGIYGRAYQLTGIPATVMGQVIDKVLFPSIAKIQSQKPRLATLYLRGANLIATVTLPISVTGFIIAPEIVDVVLGVKWTAVVLPFRILLLGFMMRSSYKFSDLLAKSTGAVYRRAWRHGIYAAMVIGGGWIGHFWGVPGVAAGVLAAVAVNYLLMTQMSLSIVGKTWFDFAKVYLKPMILTATVLAFVYPTVYLLRNLGWPAEILLAAILFLFAPLLFAVIRLAPQFFLGSDGIWMLKILGNYLPQGLRRIILPENEMFSQRAIGVKDAGTENA
ncbi:MAG: lipopolysaccharide biosynthesis protein [Pyrinomonadaceae bacterium]|nr:lipopolysaccharide biosynthesis protein [Pyrinomonadaceae bacterium]